MSTTTTKKPPSLTTTMQPPPTTTVETTTHYVTTTKVTTTVKNYGDELPEDEEYEYDDDYLTTDSRELQNYQDTSKILVPPENDI